LRRVAERFIAAANTGDLDALLTVLDPEVAGWTDSGGLVPAPQRTIVGRDRIAAQLFTWLRGDGIVLHPATVNGRPGALAMHDDALIAVLALSLHDGLVARINAVANPEKLERVRSALAAQRDAAPD